MNNKTELSSIRPESPHVNRRQFCTALGMMGIAVAIPGFVSGHPLELGLDDVGPGPRGRRKTFSKTAGIL